MNTKIKTWVGTVVIIIIAITVGAFVWIYEKNQPEIAQPVIQGQANRKGATPKTISSIPSNNQNYVEVKELGFKIPVDASMVGELTYKIIELEGVPYPSAEIDLKTGGCEGGVISRILGTPSKNVTGESEFYTARMSDIKQFDGFFLFYQHPQAVSCDVAKFGNVQWKVIQATSDGFKNISLVDQFSAISDWQTYRNEKYGFEFKYPKSIIVKDISKEIDGSEGKCLGIEFNFSSLYVAIPNYDYPCGRTGVGNEYDVKQNQSEKIKIGSTEFTATGLKEYKGTVFNDASFWVTLNNKIQIQYNYGNLSKKGTEAEYQDGQALIKQILSTFKFIN